MRFLILFCALVATFAAEQCTVNDYTGLDAIKEQSVEAGKVDDGTEVTWTAADGYKCYGSTATCDDGCLKLPICKPTFCIFAPPVPTGFEYDSCESDSTNPDRWESGTKCSVKNNDDNYDLISGDLEVTCNDGMWTNGFVSGKKENCQPLEDNDSMTVGTIDGDFKFGDEQTIQAKEGYKCSTDKVSCGYDGNTGGVLCAKNTCAASPDNEAYDTPDCGKEGKTKEGESCEVELKEDYVWIKSTSTMNARTMEVGPATHEEAGDSFTIPCVDNMGLAFPGMTAQPNWQLATSSQDPLNKALLTNVQYSTRKATCSGLTSTAQDFWEVDDCEDGKKGDSCTLKAKDDYECLPNTLTSTCALSKETGTFLFGTPECQLKEGCDVPDIEGASVDCADRVAVDVECTFSENDATKADYDCENMEKIKCTATGWEKVPSCTFTGEVKGDRSVQVYFFSQNGDVNSLNQDNLKKNIEDKVEAVAGKPEDYTTTVTVQPGTDGFAQEDGNAVGRSEWYTSGSAVSVRVTDLTDTQLTALVSSFKNNGADYGTILDATWCAHTFSYLGKTLDMINEEYYDSVYIDGKLDIPILPTIGGGLAGAAATTSASTFIVGVTALVLAMFR